MSIAIKYNFEEVERYLDTLCNIDTVLQLEEFMGEELVAVSNKAFETESDPVTGKRWQQSIRAKQEGGQTLSKRANLKRSITYEVDGNIIKVGSPLIYAAIHQEGGSITAKRSYLKFKVGDRFVQKKSVYVPQRRFLGLPDDFVERLFSDRAIKEMLGI